MHLSIGMPIAARPAQQVQVGGAAAVAALPVTRRPSNKTARSE